MTEHLDNQSSLNDSETFQSDQPTQNKAQSSRSLAEFGDFIDAYFSLCNHPEIRREDAKR